MKAKTSCRPPPGLGRGSVAHTVLRAVTLAPTESRQRPINGRKWHSSFLFTEGSNDSGVTTQTHTILAEIFDQFVFFGWNKANQRTIEQKVLI
jgi:hypothetical protein